LRFAVTAASVLVLGAAACGELDNPTTVKDLRVLGVKCDPAGFLVDLQSPGAGTDADWSAQITALVVDPLGQGQELQLTAAAGCPDYIDTITSATMQGTKICPPESATSQFPDPIGPLLRTTTLVTPDMPRPFMPTATGGIQYEPTISFGLRTDQVAAFFSPMTTGIAALDQSIAYNREFGIPAIVNLTFTLGGERVEAIKHVVYWPRLNPDQLPDPSVTQVPNQNPVFGDPADPNPMRQKLRLYSHRDETTGNPDQPITNLPATISISAEDKLYVDPIHDFAAEGYLLRVRNVDTGQVETRVVDRELIRFYFYATAGTFADDMSFSEPNPVTGAQHTDSEYRPPKPEEVPAGGIAVTIWVVAHDERAGTDWTSTTITVVP
jgi:hypothetical protein